MGGAGVAGSQDGRQNWLAAACVPCSPPRTPPAAFVVCQTFLFHSSASLYNLHMEWSDQMDDLRARTPGASAVIHLNNAGCSLPSAEVLDATIAFLQAEAMQGGCVSYYAMTIDAAPPPTTALFPAPPAHIPNLLPPPLRQV